MNLPIVLFKNKNLPWDLGGHFPSMRPQVQMTESRQFVASYIAKQIGCHSQDRAVGYGLSADYEAMADCCGKALVSR